MKKFYITLFFSFFGLLNVAAQTVSDQNELLKQCVTFQNLTAKIPQEILTGMMSYDIHRHGIDYNNSLGLETNGKQILYLEKGDLAASKSYFQFHTLNIEGNTAFVRYYFIYNINNVKTTIPITINFEKDNSVWRVMNFTI